MNFSTFVHKKQTNKQTNKKTVLCIWGSCFLIVHYQVFQGFFSHASLYSLLSSFLIALRFLLLLLCVVELFVCEKHNINTFSYYNY